MTAGTGGWSFRIAWPFSSQAAPNATIATVSSQNSGRYPATAAPTANDSTGNQHQAAHDHAAADPLDEVPVRFAAGGGCARVPWLYGVLMAVKLALVVRTDLGMGRGKIAAQVAHAAVAAVLATGRSPDFAGWLAEGQQKVVLRAGSAEQLLDVARRARAAGLPVEVIQDAGRTQVPPGTVTCCAIGPADGARMDPVTAELTLL